MKFNMRGIIIYPATIITRNRILFVLIMCLSYGSFFTGNAQATGKAPNIILIYADDLGYSDIGCYGREYGADFFETPNIDRLSSESVRFTNAYAAAPLCSPSRAALLTGKTPARLNFEFVTTNPGEKFNWDDSAWTGRFKKRKLIPPPHTLNLPLEEETIAELLKMQGYSTAMVGKWHVSSHYKVYNGWNPEFGPSKQGFDWTGNTFGAWGSAARKARGITIDGKLPADALTDTAISFLHEKHEKPFFLFVSHYYVHDPLDTTINWIVNKYKQKAKGHNLKISDQRIRFGAFVETFDHYVGQLLDAIDAAGLRENTLVVFTSDNGGMPVYSFNRPFRGSKWNLYEGGIRIPLLIRYPGSVKENSVCNAPVSQIDFMPTFYELATGKTKVDKQIDGVSFMPLLNGKAAPKSIQERSLVWHFPYYHALGNFDNANPVIGIEDGYASQTYPSSAIRKGRFKLLYFYEDERVELYDLEKDPQEQVDISKKETAKANAMKGELLAYLNSVNARMPKRK